jgi:hypothetical protein
VNHSANRTLTRLITCIITLLALGSVPLIASENGQADLERCSELELRVAGLFRIGTASLYMSDCARAREDILNPVAKQFSLELARSFSGQNLSEAARDALVANLGLDDGDMLPAPLACLADAYVDVERGDRYDVIYLPRDALSLYLNDELIKRCDDTEQAEKYFLIWFGQEPFHRRMRDRLLDQANKDKLS